MYQMPVKAIKSILGKELQSHYSTACQSIYNDIQRGFIHLGYQLLLTRLEQAKNYQDLEDILSMADYRMSLQEWINSL